MVVSVTTVCRKPQKPAPVWGTSSHNTRRWPSGSFLSFNSACPRTGNFLLFPSLSRGRAGSSHSVCKFISCPAIDCLALVCFKMLLLNKQRLIDRGAAGASSPSIALSCIPQQGHGSSCPDWLEIECVLSNKCDNLYGFCLHKVVSSV